MAAVVRVKRLLEEEPLEAVILSCKKRKLNADIANDKEDAELSTALLKFAGTIKEDENVVAHLKKERIPEIAELRDKFKKHTVDLNEKLREEMKETSKSNRYKVVNCFRSRGVEDNSPSALPSTAEVSEFTIFDIETDFDDDARSENQNGEGSVPKYVFDLYYTNSDDFGDVDVENFLSVCPYSDSLKLDSFHNGIDMVESDEDSEDSNAENNWRNDYPDESDDDSIKDEDMMEAMQNLSFGEDLLSTTDEEVEENFLFDYPGRTGKSSMQCCPSLLSYSKDYMKFKAANKNLTESTSVDHNYDYDDDYEEDED